MTTNRDENILTMELRTLFFTYGLEMTNKRKHKQIHDSADGHESLKKRKEARW